MRNSIMLLGIIMMMLSACSSVDKKAEAEAAEVKIQKEVQTLDSVSNKLKDVQEEITTASEDLDSALEALEE